MKKRTRIVLVLDKSGSMGSVTREALGAFNEAIDDIKKNADDGGETFVSVITFNHDIHEVFMNEKVEEVHHLSQAEYSPMGSTALRDAIGHAIESIQTVDSLEGDAAALVVVVTDGYENASSKWSQTDLAEKIQELESTEKWTFTMMCANVDITKIEQDFNLCKGNVAAFVSSGVGTQNMGKRVDASLNVYMTARRFGSTQTASFYTTNEERTSESN